MQIITRGKTARSHADVPPSCLLHDAIYQDHGEKKVQTGATFGRLLRKLADQAGRIHEQHYLQQDSPVIIIMDWVASHSQKALTPIKGHVHQCKDHFSQYICFGTKRCSHISNLPYQLINPSMRRFDRLSMVKHGTRIQTKEIPAEHHLTSLREQRKACLFSGSAHGAKKQEQRNR